jgi:ABC-type amino acid transport system permease subunit
MTNLQAMRRVILPQALRVIIPPTGNEFIAMLKNTSIAPPSGAELLRRRAASTHQPSRSWSSWWWPPSGTWP